MMNLQGTRTFYMPYLALYIRFVFLVLIGCFVLTDCNEDKQYATSEVQINTTSSISDFSEHVVDVIKGNDLSNDSSLQVGSQFSNGSTIKDTVMRSTIVTPRSSQTERNSFVSTSIQSELKVISTEKPSMKTATIDQTNGTSVARIPYFLLFGDKTDYATPNMSELDSTQLIESTSKPKTKADLVILDSCSQYGTCEHISKYSFQFCNCDSLCPFYDDCCLDADRDILLPLDILYHKITPECIPFRKAGFPMIRGNFVINTCADYWGNSRTAIKCRTTDILTVGPWVVETDTNLVFQNGYCAQCNNISEYKQFAVKISNMPIDIFLNITDSVMYDALNTYWDNDLIMEFVPPEDVKVRSCLILIQSTIEKEDCMNYYVNPVIKLGGMVRNKFCIHQDEFVACAGMFDLPDDIKIDPYGLNPLSGIFYFNESCKTEKNVNGICMDEALYENFYLTTYLYLIPSTNLSENIIEEICFIVVWSFGTQLNTRSIVFKYFDKVGNYSDAPFVCYVKLSFSFVNKLTAKEIMVFKSKFNDMERLILLKSQHGLVYEVYTVRTNERRDAGYQEKRLSQPQIKRKIDNLNVNMTGNHEVELCGKSIIKCELSKDAEEKKMIIKEVTCNDSIQQSLLSTAMTTEDFVKYTVMGISIIVSTASVIFNRRLGTLRSISDSNLENLLNTLIISDMIFLIGIAAAEHFTVCYIVGVFLHFLWLLVFSFQSIALYLIIKINMSDNSANESGTKRYKKIPFTLFALFLPFVFVAPAVILDLMKIPDFSLNYSGFICFPTGYPANLMFVYIPIGLSVVNNISLLAFIALALKKNTLGKSTFLQNVPVFFQITVVTCIPWFIGFLGIIIQTELMDFLFVICYGIQGLLIAIVSLTARRAYYSFCKQSPTET